MKHAKFLPLLAKCFWVLAVAAGLSVAHADEYADALLLMRSAKFPEALVKADQYLATHPKDPQMRFLKGVLQREVGKIPDAIATFTRLSEEYPELPEPYNNLAVLYAAQSQFDKARNALEMAIRTNPSYSTAHENLGDVYAKLASEAYNKALQLDNANTAVAPKLALIRELFNPAVSKTRPANTSATAAATNTPSGTGANSAAASNKPAAQPIPPAAPPATNSSAANTTTAPSGAASKPAAIPPIAVAKPEPVTPPAANTGTNIPPRNTPVTDTAKDTKEVEAAVKNWAAAWSAKDVKAYLAVYGKTFAPPKGQSRSEWEEERRSRIMGKSSITVKLSNLATNVQGSKATVRFSQAYQAGDAVLSSRKTLELLKTGEQWKIVKESVSN